MDQSEIDALLMAGGKSGKGKKAPAEVKAAVRPKATPPPALAPATPQAAQEVRPDAGGHVIVEIDSVTEVTERETNKVMDQLDLISQLVGRQQDLITSILAHPGTQDPEVQSAISEVMTAAKDIQGKVFEAMDLMQFQDITRQKLERIVFHLRQIHDYIVELLGTGEKSQGGRPSLSRTIAQTGTTPDERKAHADSVVEEFLRGQNKD
jgi:hypothetical protein